MKGIRDKKRNFFSVSVILVCFLFSATGINNNTKKAFSPVFTYENSSGFIYSKNVVSNIEEELGCDKFSVKNRLQTTIERSVMQNI